MSKFSNQAFNYYSLCLSVHWTLISSRVFLGLFLLGEACSGHVQWIIGTRLSNSCFLSLTTLMCRIHTRGRVCLVSVSHLGLHVAMNTSTVPYSLDKLSCLFQDSVPVSFTVVATELSLLTRWLPTPKSWNFQVQHLPESSSSSTLHLEWAKGISSFLVPKNPFHHGISIYISPVYWDMIWFGKY